jgi:hypothetical protein
MKKFWVLFALFIVPLIFYLLLTTGINNFSKLPIVTSKINDISAFSTSDKKQLTLNGKISVICFLGDSLLERKTNALNLNEKIYKHFYQYKDFQMIALLPFGAEPKTEQLKKELGYTTNLENWYFLFGSADDLQIFYLSLQSQTNLDKLNYSPLSFIVDKDRNLRGRTDDEDSKNSLLYGYDASIVSPIHQKMVDDIKVLLAEYRKAKKEPKSVE